MVTPHSPAQLLLLFLLLCSQQRPIRADIGRRKADDQEAAGQETEVIRQTLPDTEATIANTVATAEPTITQPGTTSDLPPVPAPPRPPSIVEAEARTARELVTAVAALTGELAACRERVDAVEEGFQGLYAAHLANVDGLRRCWEGGLPAADLRALDGVDVGAVGGVDPALLARAGAVEDARARARRDDALAARHRALLVSLEDRVATLVRRERSWERTIAELVARRDLLERREGAWERTIGELLGDIEVRARREEWWSDMRAEMEGRIGALSRAAAEERFGPGPHHVAMTVLLDEANPASLRTLVFRLAPLRLVPHSVHLFLSQVADGHWSRGTPAVVLRADHVLQACPHPCLDRTRAREDPYPDLRRAGLDAVAFQEYSPAFPHARYTLGFAGRPRSGPEFYINLLDNTLDHGTPEERRAGLGPAGDAAWAEGAPEEPEEAAAQEPYPCFGKLVEGFEAVDEMARGMTRASLPRDEDSEEGDTLELDEHMLLRPVRISSMTILEDYNLAATVGGGDDEKRGKERGSTTNDEL